MRIRKAVINKEIKRVMADQSVDTATKKFLVNWLKDGLNGPDEILRGEMVK